MPKTFKCPSCAAPLDFNDSIIENCKYCNAPVMAPPEVYENETFKQKQKVKKVNAIVNNFLENNEFGNVNVIDLSKASREDINQNLSGILSEVRAGHESDAVKVFKKTYHVSGNDAQQVIDSMKAGSGFDLSGLNIDLGHAIGGAKKKQKRNNAIGWILFVFFIVLTILGILGVIALDWYFGG